MMSRDVHEGAQGAVEVEPSRGRSSKYIEQLNVLYVILHWKGKSEQFSM